MQKYTSLPYVFDLLYDIKSLEDLHSHLTGERRLATSATDAQLIDLMVENNIPLPPSAKPELNPSDVLRDTVTTLANQPFVDPFVRQALLSQESFRKTPITMADGLVEKRRAAVNFANASLYLSGMEVSPEAKNLQERYILGEISLDECIETIKANSIR